MKRNSMFLFIAFNYDVIEEGTFKADPQVVVIYGNHLYIGSDVIDKTPYSLEGELQLIA